MVVPCGQAAFLARASDSVVARLLPARPAVADGDSLVRVEPASPGPSRSMAWLLAGALALAVAELFLRRGVSDATA
jgi:hypothetical protein